jgi:phenylpropionate dioxygenase-like ring-hydroxylating dioxygenase large terminal subunit
MTESKILPIPTGWFCVAFSHELQPREVKPLEVFGQHLVMFRTTEGKARVLDAHCPHLGAHLARPITGGEGGKVDGDAIRCPFHDWRWDGATGKCVHIPYAKRIPENARTRAWTVVERGGLIMVWHGPEGEEPSFDLPTLEEFDGDAYTVVYRNAVDQKSTPLDMGENSVDLAHFVTVHGLTEYPKPEDTTITSEGERLRISGPSDSPRAQELPFDLVLDRQFFGLGFVTIRFLGIPGTNPLLLIATTPIDEKNCITRWTFFANKETADTIGVMFTEQLMQGVIPDFPIWEHKVFVPRPILCDGDGPVAEYRRWARQFYPESAWS